MKHPLLNQQVTLRGIPVIVRRESEIAAQDCNKCAFYYDSQGMSTDCFNAELGTDVPPCWKFSGTYYEEVQA